MSNEPSDDEPDDQFVPEQATRGGIGVTTWLCGSPPRSGQFQRYPSRFLFNVHRTYPEFVSPATLHMFAGSCEFGTSTDLRAETGADITAPFDAIPCEDHTFDHVLADPPYADHWQGQWHGDLPKPKHILREAARLVRAGGLIGILHIIVIPAYKEYAVERVGIHPVLAGPNNAIRVFNVFRANGAPSMAGAGPVSGDRQVSQAKSGRLVALTGDRALPMPSQHSSK